MVKLEVLSTTETSTWIGTLRRMRSTVRDTVESFVNQGASEDGMKKMRVEVCETIVTYLRELLSDYWFTRYNDEDCDFFYSPGYRPYGQARAPLAGEGIDSLGRQSNHTVWNQTCCFALTHWMGHVYEQTSEPVAGHYYKIGGFTDWFGNYKKVHVVGEGFPPRDELLIALVLSRGERNVLPSLDRGVARFTIEQDDAPAKFLEHFVKSVERMQQHKRMLFFADGGNETIPSWKFVPYPPLRLVNADGSLSDPLKRADWGAAEKIIFDRFASLFHSIFFRPAKPTTRDPLIEQCFSEILNDNTKKHVCYAHYHVFVTDQDLSMKGLPVDVGEIGTKVGTFNLYTQYPIDDVALGLLRDSIESAYDTVRDAEILSAARRQIYLTEDGDEVLGRWLRVYLDEVRSGSVLGLPEWSHERLNKSSPVDDILGRMAAQIEDLSFFTDGERRLRLKLVFETDYIVGDTGYVPTRGKVKKDRSYEDELPAIMELFKCEIGQIECRSRGENTWTPPTSPPLCFFVSLARVLHTLSAEKAPAKKVMFWSGDSQRGVTIELDCDAYRQTHPQREPALERAWREADTERGTLVKALALFENCDVGLLRRRDGSAVGLKVDLHRAVLQGGGTKELALTVSDDAILASWKAQ